jgi:60 kDa SS-A/Ro ribonucleoprotein
MSKFNNKVSSKTINLAGGNAYSMNAEQELVHAVLTTFLEDKYYEKGDDRMVRIRNLIAQCKPQFVANLAIVARKEFNLRSVSHLLVAELSKIHRGDSLVKDTIVEIAIRPDDLTEIVACVGMPIPKQVKRGVRNALLKYDRYKLAKYKGESKKISLVDLFNLVHPKVKHANKEQKKAWKDLMTGKLVSFDTWETELSNAKTDNARKKALESLIAEDKMGYMSILRNLNNLIKYDVSKKCQSQAIKKLVDPKEIKNSKQLPFRYLTAFNNVKGNREFSDAISEAMDIAVSNTPELKGKILIAVDSSGSMSGDPMDKASIFGATLLKANPRAELILYDTDVKQLSLSGRTPVIDLAENIKSQAMGGGTETSLVFRYAMQSKKKYSRIIIISDNESWNEDSVQDIYRQYVRESENDPFVYAIDIQGYGSKDIKGGKVFNLCGWSDKLLDFIGQIEKGDTLVEYIRNYKLAPITKVL